MPPKHLGHGLGVVVGAMLPEHEGRHQRADPPRYICPTERWHKGRRKAASMKFTINIDCTPEEARAYLGLPDVRPMQEQLLKEMQDRFTANIRTLDPEAIMRMWFPMTLKGIEQFQDMLFAQMARATKE